MSASYDAVIIGGGVNGCSIAYNLTRRGLKVALLEKGEIGGEASGSNGGGVRQSARDPRELALAMDSVRMFATLAEELGAETEYCRGGNLRFCFTAEQAKTMGEAVARQQAAGLDVRMLDAAGVRQANPYVSDKVVAASYCPTDGHANPLMTTFAFMRAARRLGAHIRTREPATGIVLRKGRVAGVATPRETIPAGLVVNAAGVGGRTVARMAGLDFPLAPLFTEVLVTEARPPMFTQMVGTAQANFYGHQTRHGSFVFGGILGVESYLHEGHAKPNYSHIAPFICRMVRDYFPALADCLVLRTWSGLIEMVADKVPVLGPTPEVPGFWFAAGFSGHGFGISPAVGKAMAEWIVDGRPSIALDAFSHQRFANAR